MIQPMPGGGLKVDCLSLKTILVFAYDVQDYQVSGGPAWVQTMRWNIVAKPNLAKASETVLTDYSQMSNSERSQYMNLVRQRLQALLAERFRLILRHETGDQTVYALTVARNGPRLKESTGGSGPLLKRGRGKIEGMGAQMAELTRFLAIDLRRPVIDRTGLTGRFDFNLEWTAEDTSTFAVSSDNSGPSIVTAIQEQLGLKLEAQKAPTEILIIEKAEMPPDN
jgi:uncharacterized protein (TIGR03435 family)